MRRAGITEQPELIKSWDTNVSFGGPIKRDRLWFFNNLRSYGTYQDVPGVYTNANALDASKWKYLKDPAVKARSAGAERIESIRLTGQLTPRNKLGGLLRVSGQLHRVGARQLGRRLPRPR